jgi:hypothetical protein
LSERKERSGDERWGGKERGAELWGEERRGEERKGEERKGEERWGEERRRGERWGEEQREEQRDEERGVELWGEERQGEERRGEERRGEERWGGRREERDSRWREYMGEGPRGRLAEGEGISCGGRRSEEPSFGERRREQLRREEPNREHSRREEPRYQTSSDRLFPSARESVREAHASEPQFSASAEPRHRRRRSAFASAAQMSGVGSAFGEGLLPAMPPMPPPLARETAPARRVYVGNLPPEGRGEQVVPCLNEAMVQAGLVKWAGAPVTMLAHQVGREITYK